MRRGLDYFALWVGLFAAASSIVSLARSTYYTHCWVPGAIAIVGIAIATPLVFLKLRSEGLHLGPNSEGAEVKEFNKKAKAFMNVNAFLGVSFMFMDIYFHHHH
ncbi:MAG: hypothetical protein ACP5EP_03100 [Acidobacteriaceae bacterium]